MKLQYRKMTAWLLTLAMLFTMLPGLAITAGAADSYGLTVSGTGYQRGTGVMEHDGSIETDSSFTAAVIKLDDGANVTVSGEGYTYQ